MAATPEPNLHIIRSSVVGTVVMCALLFIPAGSLGYWQGWLFIATFAVSSLAYTAYLAKHDPALLKRRTEAGISHEKEPVQKIVMACLYVVCVALVVASSLDVRFGWSRLPWLVSVLGDLGVAYSFYLFYLVAKVNTYAAANVRVEEGQTVVSTGMYGIVRHPMYSAAIVLFVATPLALGSWWTLVLTPLCLLILVARILNEEDVLIRELPGYAEYREQIRARLIPFVW
jgi:protein-S-isoprenylcysteine O-methyltransferase Ste14